MPTITELPVATTVNPADEVLVSQGGATRSVSLGTMLAGMQPAIMAPTGSLLGRVSLGAGGPEPITVGTGLSLAASVVQANGADHATYPTQTTLQLTDQAVLNSSGSPMLLPLSTLRGLFSAGTNITISPSGVISSTASGSGTTVASGSASSIAGLSQITSLGAGDLVAVSQQGTDHTITYADLIDGETIDQFGVAAPVADSDVFPVGQGTSTMLAQTFSAVWNWMQGKLPLYKPQVLEVTTNITLDGSVHNGRVLVCSAPLTLTHSTTQGSGFICTVINASSGLVTLDSGILTTSGVNTLASGQMAEIYCVTYSAGTAVYAWMSGPVAAPVPGQVTGITVGAVTYTSVALTWAAPVSGGTPTAYVIQYRVTGTTAWTAQASLVANATILGLVAATEYDIQIIAENAGGNGAASPTVNATTLAAPTAPPGQVSGLATSAPSAATITLSWGAPVSGGAVASYTVQYRVTGQTAWITAATGITALGFVASGLTASTQYDFQVFAVNSAGNGSPSSIANGTTTIAPPGTPSGLSVASPTTSTILLSWVAPSSGGIPASYTVQYRVTGGSSWTPTTGITGTSTTITGLTSATQYDFQVAAVNLGGSSAFTATINGTTTISMPGVPTGLTVGLVTNTTVALSWAAPTGGGAVASYTVQYSNNGGASWTQITGLSGTSTTLSGLSANQAYLFEVSSVNAGGSSAYTSSMSGTTTNFSMVDSSFSPGSSLTCTHGTSPPNGVNVNTQENLGHTIVGSATNTTVQFVYAASNSVVPTSGWSASGLSKYVPSTGQTGYPGSYWGGYVAAPGTVGTWYVWWRILDPSSNVLLTHCSSYQITTT